MGKIKILYHKFRDLILYGFIGLFSSSLDFCVFSVLVNILSINYIFSNTISVLAGIITSFILNRKYNFKVKDRIIRRFIIFLSVGLCGMLISNFILYICIDMLSLQKLISKLLSIVIVVIIQFLINKYVTFKK